MAGYRISTHPLYIPTVDAAGNQNYGDCVDAENRRDERVSSPIDYVTGIYILFLNPHQTPPPPHFFQTLYQG